VGSIGRLIMCPVWLARSRSLGWSLYGLVGIQIEGASFSNTLIATILTNRIHLSCAPEDGLVKPETCTALIAIKIVF
jgi:hypothetical protein